MQWVCVDLLLACISRPFTSLVNNMSSVNTTVTANTPNKALLDDIKEKGIKVTRSYAREAEKNWKEYYLNLGVQEKRKAYLCGLNYTLLDDVKGWPDYAETIGAKVRRTAKPLYDVEDVLNTKISMWRGDITSLEIDVICNAANNSLLGGGGVDGAIHRAAGVKMREECASIGRCDTGDAKLTGGYRLPAKYILHTVGPVGEYPGNLASCYKTCLNLAKKHKLRTIAFPCISTGIYGYDIEKATPVVLRTVRDWLLSGSNKECVDRIIFCLFPIKDVTVYEHNLLMYFPVDKPSTEIPEKKKPKTIESAKGNTEKAKENKQTVNDSPKSTESATETEENSSMSTDSITETEENSSQPTESVTDTKKNESERNKSAKEPDSSSNITCNP